MLKTIQAVFLVLVITGQYGMHQVEAADTRMTPKIAVSGGYDDNILYTTDEKLNSSIVTVSPGLEVDYQTPLSSLVLKADLDILRYLDESDQDRTNQYYILSGDHRIKERWTTGLNFKFYQDTTLNSYLQETGRARELVQRDFFEAGGKVGYDITNISKITARYRYQDVAYEGDALSDYYSHMASLYYSHRLKSAQDTLSLGPSYYHRKNDENVVDYFSLDLGWERDWSTITNSDITVGARYSTVENTDDGTTDDTWGARASVGITHKGIVTSTTFKYFHDLGTTVDGDDINIDNFFLSYRRALTERFGLLINGRLVFSYKLFNDQANVDDERYYWIEPGLYYELTRYLDLSLRYRYQNNVLYQNEGDQTKERNIIELQLSYGFPVLF